MGKTVSASGSPQGALKAIALGQDIRDWFSRKQEGKPFSAGLERLYVELGALESLAHDGKVDLTKIQVEGVIVKVVKDKFPPQPSQK